jgi:hypothetical protein
MLSTANVAVNVTNSHVRHVATELIKLLLSFMKGIEVNNTRIAKSGDEGRPRF